MNTWEFAGCFSTIICTTFDFVFIVSVVVEPVGRSWYSRAESWAFHRKVFETQNEGSSRLGGSIGGCAVDGSSVLRPVLHNSDRHLHQLPQPSAGGCPHHFMCSPGMFQCCGAQAKTLEAFCGPKFANCRLLVSICQFSHNNVGVCFPGVHSWHEWETWSFMCAGSVCFAPCTQLCTSCSGTLCFRPVA